MRISERDKMLLVLLGVILVLAGYYFLVFVPQEARVQSLESERQALQNTLDEIHTKLASEPFLDKNIKTLTEQVETQSAHFYPELTHEEALLSMVGFSEGLPLSYESLSFAAPEADEAQTALYYDVTAKYSGAYADMLTTLRNIRSNTQKVAVRNLEVNNRFEEGLTGSLVTRYYVVPKISDYALPQRKLVTPQINMRDLTGGPFEPYAAYVPETTAEETPPPEYAPAEVPDVDYEGYRPKARVYGFEEGGYFFVANHTDINGHVTRSKTKISGGYSADLSFDFVAARDYSEANIVFDTQPVMLNRPAAYIGVWIYAFEASNHKIGMVILDAKGKEYRIELAPMVNWTQWSEVEAELPIELSYPCMVQRIYVEGIGFDQKLTARYLFDQMYVSYPVN